MLLGSCGSNDVSPGSIDSPLDLGYRIGPSDVLTITIFGNDDMSRTVTVRPDGIISYPLLGELRVTGLTPFQVRAELVESLQEFMNVVDREVSVVVDEVHSYKVSVLGEVRAPGRFEFQNNVTVLDALAEAGGLTEFASRTGIVIMRPGEEGTQRIVFDYERLIGSGNEGPIPVYPGDIILVP